MSFKVIVHFDHPLFLKLSSYFNQVFIYVVKKANPPTYRIKLTSYRGEIRSDLNLVNKHMIFKVYKYVLDFYIFC